MVANKLRYVHAETVCHVVHPPETLLVCIKHYIHTHTHYTLLHTLTAACPRVFWNSAVFFFFQLMLSEVAESWSRGCVFFMFHCIPKTIIYLFIIHHLLLLYSHHKISPDCLLALTSNFYPSRNLVVAVINHYHVNFEAFVPLGIKNHTGCWCLLNHLCK